MKQFGVIFKFELNNYLKNKVFIGITIFLVILVAAVMFFPRVSSIFDSGKAVEPETGTDNSVESAGAETGSVMLIQTDSSENSETIRQAFSAAFANYEIKLSSDSIDSIKEQITSGEADCAFVLDSPTSYTYYVNNLSLYDSNTSIADGVLQNLFRMNAMLASGISAENAVQILNTQIQHETTSLGKNQFQNFFYTYIMIFALYMVIMLYGQLIATSVATEKSSRAMELLVTSAKPTSMMFGKVLASCLAGLTQLIAVFGSAYLFFNMNKAYLDGNQIIASIFDMPLSLLGYMLLFFFLGFLVYAFLFGAVGSMANKVEDINVSSMPLVFCLVICFMVVMFSMTSGTVDNVAMIICSYVPFTSPIAMFTRIAMSTVPFYEIAISVVILIASVFGIGVFSAKIYRVGVLLYGTTPKIGSILKAIRKA